MRNVACELTARSYIIIIESTNRTQPKVLKVKPSLRWIYGKLIRTVILLSRQDKAALQAVLLLL
jgi:hypothetical protein